MKPNENAVIEHMVRWAHARPDVRAVILTSSLAVPGAQTDALTDYDFILVVTNTQPFFEDRAWLGDFSPVLTVYRDPMRMEDGFGKFIYVTQYENGLKIDFTLWHVKHLEQVVHAPQLTDEFDAGYRVLLDKDQLTDGIKPPTYRAFIPKPPTETEYQEMVECFFGETFYVAKFLWRRDMLAMKYIFDHMMKQEYLRPFMEWQIELDNGWSVKPGPYGRGLKRWANPEMWAELENTYTGMDMEENWQALFRTIDLFRKVALDVGTRLGFSYPFELERRAVTYLLKVKQLDPGAEAFE